MSDLVRNPEDQSMYYLSLSFSQIGCISLIRTFFSFLSFFSLYCMSSIILLHVVDEFQISMSWFASNLSGLDVHRFSQDKG